MAASTSIRWLPIIAALIALAALVASHAESSRASTFYAAELGARPDAAGSVRLAYAGSLLRANPPVALPGVDLAAFGRSLDELEDTMSLLGEQQASHEQARALAHSLYPLASLRALVDAEGARRAFLASGQEEDLSRYFVNASIALAAARADTEDFARTFEYFVPRDWPAYGTQTSIIERSDTRAALRSYAALADERLAELARLHRCVHDDISSCRSGALMPEPLAAGPTDDSKEALIRARASMQLLEDGGITFEAGPLVVLSRSACIRERPGTAPYFAKALNGATPDAPTFVGDVMVYPVGPLRSLPFYSYFDAHGIPYVYQNPLAYYGCPQEAFDAGAVLVLSDAAQLLGMDGPVIREREAIDRINAASSTPAIDALRARYRFRSDGLYQAIRDINAYERANLELAASGIKIDFSLPYMLSVHSALPSLYSWLRPESTFGRPNDLPSDKQPFTYASSLSESARQEIVRDIIFYRSFHPDLNH